MTVDELYEAIEREYDPDVGFIGQLRCGHFEGCSLERLLTLLRTCPSIGDEPADGRLIRLLWFMPWVVEWQDQRLTREGKSSEAVRQAGDAIFRELERILGVP